MHEGCQMLCTKRLPDEAKLDQSVNLVGPSKCAKWKVCDCQAPYTFHQMSPKRHHTPFMQYIYIIESELIAPFQAHIKNFIHVISQKTYGLNFSLKQWINGWKKKNVENLFLF